MYGSMVLSMPYTALFIGSHPDGIEIGAGATVAKLVALGWNVYFCILTSEKDPTIAQERKDETIRAAACLGVIEKRVFFVELLDTELQAKNTHIDKIRKAIASNIKEEIDLVFSHSGADAQTDHQNANRITPLVVDTCPILYYPIVNRMRPRQFKPEIFIDVSKDYEKKKEALNLYKSQIVLGRIHFSKIEKLSEEYGRICDRAFVEAFELDYTQQMLTERLKLARDLCCKKPARKAHLWWISGFAILVAIIAAVSYLVDLGEVFHTHREAIIVEEFRSDLHLAGRIEGLAPEDYADLKVLISVLTDQWYIHPWDSAEPGKGYAIVDKDGSWRIETVWCSHQVRRLAMLLMTKSAWAPPRVSTFGNADRRILSRVGHLTAWIDEAPSGI